jgi:hypothetical protein
VSDPGAYRHYRIEFTRPGSVTLAEVELLSKEAIPANPISATAPTVSAHAGGSAPVPVTVHNGGSSPVSGQVTAAAPSGWTVSPDSASFGPIPAGGSQTVTLNVGVPPGTAEGGYPVKLTATTPQGTGRTTATVQVVANTIEFDAGSDAEKPWLADPDGSQLTTVNGVKGRYADNGAHFTYRFDLPADVTGGTLTMDIGNEYAIDVSSDGQTWRNVARESREIHGLENYDNPTQTFDLDEIRGDGGALYVRVSDSKPDDGWGGWLGHLKLAMTTG